MVHYCPRCRASDRWRNGVCQKCGWRSPLRPLLRAALCAVLFWPATLYALPTTPPEPRPPAPRVLHTAAGALDLAADCVFMLDEKSVDMDTFLAGVKTVTVIEVNRAKQVIRLEGTTKKERP